MEDPELAAIDHLLTAARAAQPGWADEFGGPEGVALAADLAAEVATRLTTDLLSLRTAALAQLLERESLRSIAQRTGINRSTISKSNRAWLPEMTPFAHLTDEDSW